MRLVLKYLKKHIVIFLISTMFLAMEAFADLLQPTFMSFIVDEGVEKSDIKKILTYGGIMLCIAAVGALSAVMRNNFASRTSQTIGKELRRDIYHNVEQLSLENIDKLKPASIITRITNDVTQVQEFINSMMRMMIKGPVTCIGAIVLIILQTPKQAPVIISIVVIVALLILANMKIGYPRFGKVQKTLDKLNSVSREFLSSIRVVKAFNAEDNETEKFSDASSCLAKANTSALRTMALFAPLINLTVNMGIVVLLLISQSTEKSQIGKLMASVNYMTQILFAVTMISNFINVAVRAMASSERISEVLDEKPSQKVLENPLMPEIKGSIDFDNVSFRYYGAGSDALTNISFHVNAGETIGIIGPTGSGKTTLVNLIPRLYDATTGTVLVDDCNVNEIDEKLLRTSVSVVPQKALLFTGKICDNLRFGNDDATDDEIKKAAKIACADSFINATKDGYDTILGQGGVNLSGGQKQRISLARALVKEPKILILDDCTSALDATTESKVLSGLRQYAGEMTVMLISQRISTVMSSDKILCVDNGSIHGFGTHTELMKSCSTYQAIYESQIGKDDLENYEVKEGGNNDGK